MVDTKSFTIDYYVFVDCCCWTCCVRVVVGSLQLVGFRFLFFLRHRSQSAGLRASARKIPLF